MSSLIVVAEMRLPAESLPTFQTEVWPLLGMNALVDLQVIFPGKTFIANITHVGLATRMQFFVFFENLWGGESLPTGLALVLSVT